MHNQFIPAIEVFVAFGTEVVRRGVFLMTFKQTCCLKGSVAIFESAFELFDRFNFSYHLDSLAG
jgi:hypothetical protein